MTGNEVAIGDDSVSSVGVVITQPQGALLGFFQNISCGTRHHPAKCDQGSTSSEDKATVQVRRARDLKLVAIEAVKEDGAVNSTINSVGTTVADGQIARKLHSLIGRGAIEGTDGDHAGFIAIIA